MDFSARDTGLKRVPDYSTFNLGAGSEVSRKEEQSPSFLPCFHHKLPKACNKCVITVVLHEVAANLPCNYSVPCFDRPYKMKG